MLNFLLENFLTKNVALIFDCLILTRRLKKKAHQGFVDILKDILRADS